MKNKHQTKKVSKNAMMAPVPAKAFLHAALFALSVRAGLSSFDASKTEGIMIPSLDRYALLNVALLALQSELRPFGFTLDQLAAAVQRFLALIQCDVSSPELAQWVERNDAGQVIALDSTLIEAAAQASMEGMILTSPPVFEVRRLLEVLCPPGS